LALVFLIIGAMAMALYSLRLGRAFRRGPSSKALGLYRDPGRSAFTRNFALLAEPTGWAMLVAIAIDLGLVLAFRNADSRGRSALFGLVVCVTLGTGFGAYALTFRPPRGLVPPWLRADDLRVGWVAPRPNIDDLMSLLLFIFFIVAALVLSVLSIVEIAG
jgi:hypothetical protein